MNAAVPASRLVRRLAPDSVLPDVTEAKVLSASGQFAASDEERKFVCLLSDQQLLIADGQSMNPFVLSYCARLDRMQHSYVVVHVPIESIARRYQASHARQVGFDHTRMQLGAKELLEAACEAQASDIHIRVRSLGTEVFYRVHSDLERVGGYPRAYGERLLATLYGAMTSISDNAYKPTERQDAAISDRDKLPDRLIGVRIATTPTSDGTLMVMRLLYNDAGETTDPTALGFTETQAQGLLRMMESPTGMNLVSGPAGSGKSTTLQRVLLRQIEASRGRQHVITVEDPVEYPITGAVQTPVTNAQTEAERSRLFSEAIANAMRLDPNTIMIGEIRDRASAQSALRAAMTGHQVWSTVHANNAIGIVDRLEDLGLPLRMVADPFVVTGLVGQRLIRLLCPHCKLRLADHPQLLAPALLERVKRVTGDDFGQVFVAGAGCPECRGRGTTGRSVVAEVIAPDQQFCDHLRAGDKAAAIDHWLNALGGQTIVEHAIDKIRAGLVDPSMAERSVGWLHLRARNAESLP